MLFSHTGKEEEQVLKPRNSSVIAVTDQGVLQMRHEGTLAHTKADEDHEYFRDHQFDEFASNTTYSWSPPPSCLLLMVRHGIAISNVDKAHKDGILTPEGEAAVIKAGMRIGALLRQEGIQRVHIFSSAMTRTRHTSVLLYSTLATSLSTGSLLQQGRLPLTSSRSWPLLCGVSQAAGRGTEEDTTGLPASPAWAQAAEVC